MVTLRLASVLWREGARERKALVASLPSDPARVVDLHRLECARLARLGEGQPERLAEVLAPSSLFAVLRAGPRALHRLEKTLAYAEKWHRRGDLPEALAPRLAEVELLPCLPCPGLLRRADGFVLEARAVQGPGGTLHRLPAPTLAAVGQHGGAPAGFCLALEDSSSVLLGGWLGTEIDWSSALRLRAGGHQRTAPLEAWDGLAIPRLSPGEVLLLPPPRLKALPDLVPGAEFTVQWPGETLAARLALELVHPTLQ